MLITFVQYLDH